MGIFLDKEKMVNDVRNWLAENYSEIIPEKHICAVAQAFYSCGYFDENGQAFLCYEYPRCDNANLDGCNKQCAKYIPAT